MGLSRGLTAAPRVQLGGRPQPGTEGLGKLPTGGQSLTVLHHSRLLLLRRGWPGLRSLQGPAWHPECPAPARTFPSWPSLLPPALSHTHAHGGGWAQSSYLGSCPDIQHANTIPVPSLPPPHHLWFLFQVSFCLWPQQMQHLGQTDADRSRKGSRCPKAWRWPCPAVTPSPCLHLPGAGCPQHQALPWDRPAGPILGTALTGDTTQRLTCHPRTHLQVHLILDGLPICPLQPAPRLPCRQGTPWARGMAQPGGVLARATHAGHHGQQLEAALAPGLSLAQGTTGNCHPQPCLCRGHGRMSPLRRVGCGIATQQLGLGQPTAKGWLSGSRGVGVPGRGCPGAPHSPISSPMLKW